jgi:hypothetical protein
MSQLDIDPLREWRRGDVSASDRLVDKLKLNVDCVNVLINFVGRTSSSAILDQI